MTFQFINNQPQTTPMPKQDDIISLTDPDTGDTMYIKKQIEHQTVFGIPDNVQIPAETVAAIEKQFGTALKFDDGKLPRR